MWTLCLLIALAFGSIVEPRRRIGQISNDRILSDDEKEAFVRRHNHWRNQAALGTFYPETKASQMPRVFWDSELAEHSKNYSRLCVWRHSSPYGFKHINYSYGENIYASTVTGMSGTDLSNAAVDSWGKEYKDYNPINRTCSAVCGHYTQVVWETSVRIGCGVTECSDIEGLSWGGTFTVCQYWPPGNYPTAPYTFATSITGESCANGVHGGSTGMDSTWTALCNNGNEICGKDTRCSSLESCSSSQPLNGFSTSYACEMMPTPAPTPSPFTGCSYTVIADGYEIQWLYYTQKGMAENGKWKWCSNEEECDRWCYANQAAGCVGVSSDVDRNKGKFFPVTSIADSDREVMAGGRITFMECASLSPTLLPLMPPEDPPNPPTLFPTLTTSRRTQSPNFLPIAAPTNPPAKVATVIVLGEEDGGIEVWVLVLISMIVVFLIMMIIYWYCRKSDTRKERKVMVVGNTKLVTTTSGDEKITTTYVNSIPSIREELTDICQDQCEAQPENAKVENKLAYVKITQQVTSTHGEQTAISGQSTSTLRESTDVPEGEAEAEPMISKLQRR